MNAKIRIVDWQDEPREVQMRHHIRLSAAVSASIFGAIFITAFALPAAETAYYPPPGEWARKKPAEVGMDAAKLNEAIAFMQSHETSQARDFSDQEIIFGKMLGSVPTERA